MSPKTQPLGFDQKGHFLFWSVGIGVTLFPYLLFFYSPSFCPSWLHRSGHFADNLSIFIRRCFVGITLSGWIWLLLCRNPPGRMISSWANRKTSLNWVWYFLSITAYTTHNVLIVSTQALSGVEFFAVASGRFLTALIVISLIWASAYLASGVSPRRLRLIPWFVPACVPGFLMIDIVIILFWNNSLLVALNKLDEQGSLNFGRQLAAGGFDLGAQGLFAVLIGVFGLLLLLFHSAHRLSLLKLVRVTPKQVVVLLIAAWSLLLIEKASGYLWKDRRVLRLEEHLFQIHLTPIEPTRGVATYSVSFKPSREPEVMPISHSKPDIIFVMIESLRGDAIAPNHSPFLAKFRDEECQSIETTWSASNATHLSWYSIFNGELPNYWGVSNTSANESGQLPASPWIRLLKANDYRLEARGVCDFHYNGMSATNFGLPHLLDVQLHAPVEGDFHKIAQPRREREIIAQSKFSLGAHHARPHFQFLALDAPHFSYEWDPDFHPPYSEYDSPPKFDPYPSGSDIQRIRNRYHNAVSWVDHLLEDYFSFLKKENRYDDALIIVTGDHGEEFHEHGAWFHCSTVYPEQTAVPILIKWPKGIRAPARHSASHLDLLPSVMDLLGATPEDRADLHGQSLLKESVEEPTQIVVTSFCGIGGICMAWHRDGHTATFRWDNPWSDSFPDTVYLDDIVGPKGTLGLDQPSEWNESLRRIFPDAFERYFSHFNLIASE